MKKLIVLVSLTMLGGMTQASNQNQGTRVRKEISEESFWQCLKTRTQTLPNGIKTGGFVCLNQAKNPSFVGSGQVSNLNNGSTVVSHFFDENGQNEKCRQNDPKLSDCPTYWEQLTKTHYNPVKYAKLNSQLQDMNKPK